MPYYCWICDEEIERGEEIRNFPVSNGLEAFVHAYCEDEYKRTDNAAL